MSALLVAALLGAAVTLWPTRSRALRSGDLLGSRSLAGDESRGSTTGPAGGEGAQTALPLPGQRLLTPSWSEVWRADPVELARRWWAARRTTDLAEVATPVLDATAAGLHAGLTPETALRLAVGLPVTHRERDHSAPSTVAPHGPRHVRRIGEMVEQVEAVGLPMSTVWRQLSRGQGSPALAFVASAWELSEQTGAPLADAVERAAQAARDTTTMRRRVGVAVAGPRATVALLTALPLAGPLFGLACGLTPGDLYLSTPMGGACAVMGLGLVLLGRAWCSRLVRSAIGGRVR